MYKVDFNLIKWEEPFPGIRAKIFRLDDRQLRLVEYSKDMPPHWCEKGHYGYMLSGELEIEFPDSTHLYRQGDGIFIPNGAQHKHRAKIVSDLVRVIFVED